MKLPGNSKKKLLLRSFALFAALVSSPLFSVSYTFNGGTVAEWVDPSSWLIGTVTASSYPSQPDDIVSITVSADTTITTSANSITYGILLFNQPNTNNITITPGPSFAGLHIIEANIGSFSNSVPDLVNTLTVPVQLGTGTPYQIFVGSGTLQFLGTISESIAGTGVEIGYLSGGVSGNIPTVVFGAPCSYTGGTTINVDAATPIQLSLTGSATLYPQGTVTVNGIFDISTSSAVQTIGDLVGAGTINLGANTLIVGSTIATTFSGSITGTGGSFFKDGAGSLTLSGTLSNTGAILANSGTLTVTGPTALNTASEVGVGAILDISSYTGTVLTLANLFGEIPSAVILTGNATISIPITASSTYSGAIQGAGNVNISGSVGNNLTLSGVSTYTGGTTLSGATTIINSSANLGSNSAPLTFDGGNLSLGGGGVASFSGNVILAQSFPDVPVINVVAGNSTLTFTGTISQPGGATGAFTLIGDGVLALTNSANANVGGISGEVTITSGVLMPSSDAALGTNSAALIFGPMTGTTTPTLVAAGDIISPARDVVLNSAAIFNPSGNTISFAGSMSGSGSITQIGSGTLALLGNNSFTAAVAVNQGVLQLGGANSIATSAGVVLGTITTPATLQAGSSFTMTATVSMGSAGAIFDSNTFALSLTNGISGTGSVTIIGGGTIAISNSPIVYSGATYIQNGTYQMVGTSTLPTTFSMNIATPGILDISNATVAQTIGNLVGSGTVFLGTTALSTNITQDSIFTGSILDGGSGGGFTKLGNAQLSLRGTISVAGNFINQQGVMALEDNGIVTSTTIFNAGTLNFRTSSIRVFSGKITGVGSVGILATGTVNWTGVGPNTHTGETRVESGTLGLGMSAVAIPGTLDINGGTVSLLASNQTAGATTIIKLRSGAFHLNAFNTTIKRLEASGGTISGSGILSLNDLRLGAFSLTNPILNFVNTDPSITYTGQNNSINSAIFSLSTAIFMPNNGTLTLQQSSGDGFTLHSGHLNIATGAYTGDCRALSGSTLNVSGPMQANSLEIEQGATLAGTGTITAALDLKGAIAPGNSIGTITLIGNQVFGATSILQSEFDVTSTSSDLVNITGALVIQPGATLTLIATPTTIVTGNKTYTLVQATAGITGNFNLDISQINPNSSYIITYNPDSILLTTAPFSSNIPGNAGVVANILNGINPAIGSDLYNVVTALQLLPTQQQRIDALNELQPSMLKGLAISAQNALIRARLAGDLRVKEIITHACNPDRERFTAWADIQVDYLDQKSKDTEPGFHSTSFGPVFGFDLVTANQVFLGMHGNYTHTNIMFDEGRGKGSLDSGFAAFYTGVYGNHYYVDAIVEGGITHCNEARYIRFTGVDRIAKGNTNAGEFLGHLEGGFIYENDRLEFRPFISSEYLYMHWQAFHEGGADSLDLDIDSSNYTMLRSEAGLNFTRCFKLRSRAKIRFGGKLSYIREDRFQGQSFKARFVSIPEEFTVNGLNPDRNLFSPAVSFNYISKTGQGRFIIDYEAEIAKQFWDQNIRLQYAFRF